MLHLISCNSPFLPSPLSLPPLQADQICYAVLCVFSYVAAGRQDQKKGAVTPSAPVPHQSHATKKAAHPPKSPVIGIQQQSPLENIAVTTTHVQPQPQQEKKSETFATMELKKPEGGNGAVAKPVNQQIPVKPTSPPASAPPVLTQDTSAPVPKPTTPPKESPPAAPPAAKPPGNLPQVPPRVQSQGSINRGPPPAIPPRPQAILQRAGTVQVQSKPPMTRTTLTRQQSATSCAPQFTPQPPPKFVIPQRQNSRTSLTRQQSNTSGGSPQSPKKH